MRQRLVLLILVLVTAGSALLAKAAEDGAVTELQMPADALAAVRDYATSGGRIAIRGTSAMRLDAATYVVTVDLGDSSDMMVLIARRFFADGGQAYWKAVPLDAATATIYGQKLAR
jgi:hypothetical protein